MKINNNRSAYYLHKVTETNIKLCKVLNEYNSLEDANKDLINLLTKKKTEKEILKDYSKKDILK